MEKEEILVKQCSRFYCEITQAFTCCACCSQRESCADPCLNHPSKCNLSISAKKDARQRKYSEWQAFKLWQQGFSDTMIAQKMGVSRQRIQTWRDVLELPAIDSGVDTSKYYMVKLQSGKTAILKDCK